VTRARALDGPGPTRQPLHAAPVAYSPRRGKARPASGYRARHPCHALFLWRQVT